ncbi:integrase_H2C2 domain-containing protein [Trichonephila clavipes]|nr:integrase_H2C2 domain-containing protein [Trichonephila clavipes]
MLSSRLELRTASSSSTSIKSDDVERTCFTKLMMQPLKNSVKWHSSIRKLQTHKVIQYAFTGKIQVNSKNFLRRCSVTLNSVADHLSRCINNITIALPDSKDLINMQREDSVLRPIIQKIDQNDVSSQVSNYFINGEGLLCRLFKRPSRSPRSNTTRKQVCIPHCLKAKILESVHSEYGGHLKFFKTYHRLSENFFWQNMYKDTKNFVRSCTVCLSRKTPSKFRQHLISQ